MTAKKTTAEPVASSDRLERIKFAKSEHAALKAWVKGGEQGDRPATPNLDAMNADNEAGVRTTARKAKSEGPSAYQGVQLASDEELLDGIKAILAENPAIGPAPARHLFRRTYERACSYARFKTAFMPLRGDGPTKVNRKPAAEKPAPAKAAKKATPAKKAAKKATPAKKAATKYVTPITKGSTRRPAKRTARKSA